MKLRSILFAVLGILAVTSSAFAAQPATAEEMAQAAPETSAVVSEPTGATAESPVMAEQPAACGDDAVDLLATDLMDEIVPKLHCGDGIHVESCNYCDQFYCFCQKISLCCYCP